MKDLVTCAEGGCIGASIFAAYGYATGNTGFFVVEWGLLMICLGFVIVGNRVLRGGE